MPLFGFKWRYEKLKSLPRAQRIPRLRRFGGTMQKTSRSSSTPSSAVLNRQQGRRHCRLQLKTLPSNQKAPSLTGRDSLRATTIQWTKTIHTTSTKLTALHRACNRWNTSPVWSTSLPQRIFQVVITLKQRLKVRDFLLPFPLVASSKEKLSLAI